MLRRQSYEPSLSRKFWHSIKWVLRSFKQLWAFTINFTNIKCSRNTLHHKAPNDVQCRYTWYTKLKVKRIAVHRQQFLAITLWLRTQQSSKHHFNFTRCRERKVCESSIANEAEKKMLTCLMFQLMRINNYGIPLAYASVPPWI